MDNTTQITGTGRDYFLGEILRAGAPRYTAESIRVICNTIDALQQQYRNERGFGEGAVLMRPEANWMDADFVKWLLDVHEQVLEKELQEAAARAAAEKERIMHAFLLHMFAEADEARNRTMAEAAAKTEAETGMFPEYDDEDEDDDLFDDDEEDEDDLFEDDDLFDDDDDDDEDDDSWLCGTDDGLTEISSPAEDSSLHEDEDGEGRFWEDDDDEDHEDEDEDEDEDKEDDAFGYRFPDSSADWDDSSDISDSSDDDWPRSSSEADEYGGPEAFFDIFGYYPD